MELMYRVVVYAGIALLVAALLIGFFVFRRRKAKYEGGLRAANTSRIKKSRLYRKLNIRYRILTVLLVLGMTGCIISSLFLAARPYKTADIASGVKKRDIILNLDVSYSLYDLNSELVDYLKGVVAGLEGDRFGINIFNTTSVTYVPLTDDYDYVVQRLDDLNTYFSWQKEYYEDFIMKFDDTDQMTDAEFNRFIELGDMLDYFEAGTTTNSWYRGSSLIGEGLGSALYSFPYLGDSDRTRVIIMCTDNENNNIMGEVVDLKDAAGYCSKNKVTVFGIFPSEEKFYMPDEWDYTSCYNGFKKAVESTGGKFYVRTPSQSVSEIVQDIQKQEAMLVQVVLSRQTLDIPEIYYLILFISLVVFAGAGLVMQK